MPPGHSSAEQTWQGVADAKLRRQLQNRENQRLSRKRKAAQREALRQALAARRTNPAAVPIPILPKPAEVQPRQTDQPNPATRQKDESLRSLRARKGDLAVRRTHQGESQQVLCAPRSLSRGISAFFAAHPDLVDPHFLRVFQFTITELLPTVGVRTAADEPIQAAICRTAMSDPLVFHGVIAGGASRLQFLTKSIEDGRVLLKAQSQIARTVRQQLSAGITTISDAVIFSIMAIAVDQNPYLLSLAPEDRYAGDFDTPVKSLGGLVWTGLIHFVPGHTTMWMHLLGARNPSLSDKVPGLIDCLQTSDLLRASALLEKPGIEMQDAYCLMAEKAAAIRPDASEADAFHVDAHFKEIILDIKACCWLIDAFYGREPPKYLEASEFVQYRNLILFRLLSLPPGVSEICRLAALVFNYGVLYPFPDPRILWNLSRQLGANLSDSPHTVDEDAGLLLWAAMVGGIAAAGTMVYDSFAESVNKFADVLGLENWSQTVALLESFIWLERACGVGGRTLWARARALSSKVSDTSTCPLVKSPPRATIEEWLD
ncbi:hypothetical protein LZ30DRAFT_711422 [Colletotrichum cereale]|nr:hypothetical protein LZ30DRAFT_711422 [Colletotrichum cereale]